MNGPCVSMLDLPPPSEQDGGGRSPPVCTGLLFPALMITLYQCSLGNQMENMHGTFSTLDTYEIRCRRAKIWPNSA